MSSCLSAHTTLELDMDYANRRSDAYHGEMDVAMNTRLHTRAPTPVHQVAAQCNNVTGYHVLRCGHHVVANHSTTICATNCQLPGLYGRPFICQTCLADVFKDNNSGGGDAETENTVFDSPCIAVEKYLTTNGLNFRQSRPVSKTEERELLPGNAVRIRSAIRPEYQLLRSRMITVGTLRLKSPLFSETARFDALNVDEDSLLSIAGKQTVKLALRPRNARCFRRPNTYTDALAPQNGNSKVQKRKHHSRLQLSKDVDTDSYVQRVNAWWAEHGPVPWPPGPRKQEDGFLDSGRVDARGVGDGKDDSTMVVRTQKHLP